MDYTNGQSKSHKSLLAQGGSANKNLIAQQATITPEGNQSKNVLDWLKRNKNRLRNKILIIQSTIDQAKIVIKLNQINLN